MASCGDEQGLISVEHALSLLKNIAPRTQVQQVELLNAVGGTLAEDVYAQIDLPRFDQSAVDGYAIATTTALTQGQQLQCVGEVRAGQHSELTLQAGQALRIFTGAPIPKGCTSIARQEIIQRSNDVLTLTENLELAVDLRFQAEELRKGALLAQRGQLLHSGAIAALAMAGITQLKIIKPLTIAVVITGDEVQQQANTLQHGQIIDANGPMIQAWLQVRGLSAKVFYVADQQEALTQLFQQLKSQFDLIISTGGVSVGDYDLIRPVALAQGFEQVFWKVRQKPGKPLFFAQSLQPHACYLFGLPGNPAAVYLGLDWYVQTLLNHLQGQKTNNLAFTAILDHPITADRRERFLRMHASWLDGQLHVQHLPKQQSHMLSNLMAANCWLRLPPNTYFQAGNMLQGMWIRETL